MMDPNDPRFQDPEFVKTYQEYNKAQNLKKMGRKIYTSQLNQKIEESRKVKNFKGLEPMWKQFEETLGPKLQKSTK